MTIRNKKYRVEIMPHQLIPILMIFLIVSSCKTTRLTSKTKFVSKNPVAQLIDQVKETQPKFNTANLSKMSMEINLNDRKFNVAVTCKIKKDSVIYFSILPFMGIELYKAELTPGNLRVFDKTNRNYYDTDYSFFSKYFGVNVDFYSFQALLFNQLFCVGEKNILVDSCKLAHSLANMTEIDFQNSTMEQKTEISATNTIQQVLLKVKNSPFQLQTNYSNFTSSNSVNYPQKITMKATNQIKQTSFEFDILRAEFNSDIKFQPTNTEHYNLSDINQLIKKQ